MLLVDNQSRVARSGAGSSWRADLYVFGGCVDFAGLFDFIAAAQKFGNAYSQELYGKGSPDAVVAAIDGMKAPLGALAGDTLNTGLVPGAAMEEGAGAAALEPLATKGCFVAGTVVQTQRGPEPIEKLKKGERVYSRDPKTGRIEFKKILKTTVRRVDVVVRLSLTDPKSGKAEQITATLEHPFWVKGKGFVAASQLGIGTEIVTRAGPPLVVKSTRRLHPTGGYLVYNAVVEDDHTYFVGNIDGGAWVHNPPCPPIEPGANIGEHLQDSPFRALHPLRADKLAPLIKKMQSGKWDWNRMSEPITIDLSNTVIAGNHRVAAAAILKKVIPEGAIERVPWNFGYRGFPWSTPLR